MNFIIKMDRTQLEAVKELLKRVDLKGAEVPMFLGIVTALSHATTENIPKEAIKNVE